MSDSITNPENVTMSAGHDDGITASPRPWRLDDGFECEIVDATGRHVLTATSRYAVPPLGDEREAANAALIVAAVNERDRLAADEARYRTQNVVLRDLVRRLITIRENLFWRKDERTGLMYYGTTIDEDATRRTIEEARAALGEDKP